jgi:hypothetical protein
MAAQQISQATGRRPSILAEKLTKTRLHVPQVTGCQITGQRPSALVSDEDIADVASRTSTDVDHPPRCPSLRRARPQRLTERISFDRPAYGQQVQQLAGKPRPDRPPRRSCPVVRKPAEHPDLKLHFPPRHRKAV